MRSRSSRSGVASLTVIRIEGPSRVPGRLRLSRRLGPSVLDGGGAVLVVNQFTFIADSRGKLFV
jgi:hypothetical protein